MIKDSSLWSWLPSWGWVGLGGALGSLGRFLLGGWLATVSSRFPWSTLVVNVSGCWVLGFLAGGVERWSGCPSQARLFLFTGVLGGYTTFSAFGLESFALLKRGAWGWAAGNILLSVVLGVLAVWAGWSLTAPQAR